MYKYRHGDEETDKELYKLQIFNEQVSDVLLGTEKEGEDGMLKEWQEDRATRKVKHKAVANLVVLASIVAGVQAILMIILMLRGSAHF